MKKLPTFATLLGLTLLIVAGVKIARQVGFDGFQTGYVVAFAFGILLLARETSRRDLEARLAHLEEAMGSRALPTAPSSNAA